MELKLKFSLTAVFLNAFTALMIVCFSSHALAQNMCAELFLPKLITISIDDDYRRLQTDPDLNQDTVLSRQKAANKMHDLLKLAVYPLAERLQQLGKITSDATITSMLLANKRSTKINTALFEDSFQGRYLNAMAESPWAGNSKLILWHASTGINLNVHRFDQSEGISLLQSNKAHWVEPSKKIVEEFGEFYQMLSMIVTPEGAYGKKFADDLLRTTQIMLELVTTDPVMRQLAADTFAKNKDLLSTHMTRAKFARIENTKVELAPLSGTAEGILSFHQFISATLGDKINGIESGSEALRQIVHNSADEKLGLTADFTSRLSMGVLAPTTLSGRYFKNAFELNSQGKLVLTSYLKTTLTAFSKSIIERGGKKGRCPLAGLYKRMQPSHSASAAANSAAAVPVVTQTEPAGLQYLAETYYRIFQTVEKSNK